MGVYSSDTLGFCTLLLLLMAWAVLCLGPAGADAASTVSMASADMVITDGSIVRVMYTGFSNSPVIEVLVYDVANPSRSQRVFGGGPAGFTVLQVADMALTASANIRVCPTDANLQGSCAYLPYNFEIMYATK